MLQLHRSGGFTVVELMVAVADRGDTAWQSGCPRSPA